MRSDQKLFTAKSRSHIGTSLKVLSVLITSVISALIGAYVAVFGAMLTGLPMPSSGSWDLRPLQFMGIGLVTGVASLLACLVILNRTVFGFRLGASFILSIIMAFVSGVVAYPLSVSKTKMNAVRAKEIRQQNLNFYNETYETIRSDPGIVVRKKWYLRWAPEWSAYFDSLSDPVVPYTSDMLSEIYQGRIYLEHTAPILQHPNFDPVLLESEFHQRFENALRGGYLDRLATVMGSPQAKDEWFHQVIDSKILDQEFRYAQKLQKVVDEWLRSKDSPADSSAETPNSD